MDGVAHPPPIIAAAEQHRSSPSDTQPFDVPAGEQVVFHVRDNLGILAVDGESGGRQ
ncbi:hypothetical protein MJ588_15930 [Klebsiella pneumoniae]|nr:hypothetical protein MJ588_15930 [Klebsiella pneumoniae]